MARCLQTVKPMKKALLKSNVTWEALTDNERSLLLYLYVQQTPQSLAEVQDYVFGDLGTGTSMTRNTLRRLRTCRLVYRTRPGTYKISKSGDALTQTRKIPSSRAVKRFIRGNKTRLREAA